MAHVAPWKKDEVARLAKLMVDNHVVGVAKIGGIPGPQMAEMRESLRANVELVGVKNRLLRLAITEAAKSKPGIAQLADKVDGQAALLATSENPFKLYKTLRGGATMAPLKGGQIAPNDITVKKGPTSFGPGRIVGDLQKVGIPAKIEQGKVVITKDATPVKEGEHVSNELALMLAKLEIKPVELSIALQGAVEGDMLYLPDILSIDEDAVFADVVRGIRTAFELSMQTAWPTSVTSEPLLTRAFKTAAALSVEAGVEFDDAAAKAYAGMLAALGKKPDDLSEELKERLGEHIDILSATPVAAAPAAEAEAPAEEEEEDEGVSEDEAAAGLGALFG